MNTPHKATLTDSMAVLGYMIAAVVVVCLLGVFIGASYLWHLARGTDANAPPRDYGRTFNG